MKKSMIWAVSAVMLVSSCDTYTGAGAYAGSTLGSILGSAIGGISGGARGSDIGSIVGMAGGAAIGAAIGAQADAKQEEACASRKQEWSNRQRYDDDACNHPTYSNDFTDSSRNETTAEGDNRIYDFDGTDYTGAYTAQVPKTGEWQVGDEEHVEGSNTDCLPVEIRHARFVDDNQDHRINRGELSKVIFEVMNRTDKTLLDVQPTVVETTGNKHIYVSPGIHVERIAPGKGIRYTALVKADNRLKNGNITIRISVLQGDGNVISQVTQFDIPTQK